MITIIDNKIQINTRLLGGSYTNIPLNNNGHTVVENGQILNIQGSDSNILDERELNGMIIAKPGSVVILKNLHLKEDPDAQTQIDNYTRFGALDILKESNPEYFFKKGLLVLGGGTDSANEKTFSSANGQFDVPNDAYGGSLLDLKYGYGDQPLVILENVKITKFGETSDVNAVTFYQNDTVTNLTANNNTYSSNINNLQIVTSKEDGIEINGGNTDISNLTINSAVDEYFVVKNGHSGTITNLNFILPSSQNSKLLTLGSNDTNDATTTTTITGVTLDVVDNTVTVDVNDIVFTRYSNYNGDIPDITYKSNLSFELTSNDEYEIFSNVTFEGPVSCVNTTFKKASGANNDACNVTLKGNDKIFTGVTLQACGGLILDTLDTSNTISDITVHNSPSFGIKLLNGSVDIGGDNTISEDTNVVKDTNVSNGDQDYLIIDSHQNGTINSLHNLMSSSGPSASLIQFIETNNKSTTNFVDGSYSVSGTYNKNNNQTIFNNIDRFTGTLPKLYVKSGYSLTIDTELQLFSDLIAESGSTFNCENVTLTRNDTSNNITISGSSAFNNNSITNLGVVKFNSQTGTMANNSFDQCGEVQIFGGDVVFSNLSIKDPDGQALVIDNTHTGTITDLIIDINNSNDSSIINLASGNTTTFNNSDSNHDGIYIKGELIHSGSKSVIFNRNNDTNITIPDFLINIGDTFTLSSNLTLPSNLIVLLGGTLSNDGYTIDKESYASGNITINTGTTSLQNTTFDSCGLIKLINLNNSATMTNLTLNTCTSMEISGGAIDVNTLTIKDASDQFLVTNNGHSGTISDFTIDTTVDHDLSFINMASGVSTTFNNVFIKGDFKYASSKPVLINRNSDTNITIPDLLISDTLTLSDDITLPSNLVVQTNGSLVANTKTFTKESYASGNITINTGSTSLENITFNSCGLLKLVSLNGNTMSNLTLNTCTGMEINGGAVDVSTLTIKDASDQFLVTNNAHSGVISNFTIDTTVDHDLSFINMASGVFTIFNSVFIKGDFKYASSKPVLINRNSDTNITIPDLLISETLTLSDDITLPSNLVVQSNGSLISNNKTISKETYASGNITINTGSSSLQSTIFDTCGLLKLVDVDTNATMNNLTLNNCTGMEISGGSVDVDTLLINSSTSDYLTVDNSHTGTISSVTFDLDNNYISNKLMKLGKTLAIDTTISGPVVVKTSSNVQFDQLLQIFDLGTITTTLPDVKLDNSTVFNLNGGEYKIFSNTIFEGTVNNSNTIISQDIGANSICNVTLKDNNKIFTDMIFNACGALIIDNLDATNIISNFTNNNSPDNGLRINSGLVNFNTVVIENATDEFVKINSHSGDLKDLKLITSNTFNKSFVDIASSVNTTFSNTDNNDNGIYIRGTLDHDGSVGIIVDADTNKTIPDLVVDSGETLTLNNDIVLPSNLVVQGKLISNGKTFTTTERSNGNITINSESSLQNTTFNSCGLLKLVGLDTNSVMSELTLNTCTGMEINGGSVDVSTLTIKDASDEFLVTNNAHSGTISNLTIDTTVDHDLSFINMASGVSTTFNNVFIKGDFKYASSKPVLINRNNDTNIIIPDLLISESLTVSDDITLPSNLVVQTNGSLIADTKTFTKESYASGNITVNTGSSSLQNIIFDSCGLLKLVSLDSNATMSSLTLNTCTGMEVSGGSIDVSTLTIKDASDQFLVTNNAHSGTISDFTIHTTVDHDLSFINMASGVSTTFNNVFIKGDFKYASSKEVLINRNSDTNITIPDLLISESLTISDDISLSGNLVVQSGASLSSSNKTFSKDFSNTSANITINTGSSSLQSTTFNSCGLLKLISLDSNATMSSLTLNTCTGMEINGGSIDVSTLTIKDASDKFLVTNNGHSGTISDFTIDTTVDHDLSFINMASGVSTAFSNVFIKGDFKYASSKEVLINRNSDTNITIPDLLISESLTLSDDITLPSNLVVQASGSLISDGKTIDKESYASGNITINTGSSSLQSTTFNSCGLLKLVSLDSNATMSSLTLNTCTGMEINGGSVDVNTLTIKDASNEFLVTNNAHSGTISNFTIDTTVDHDLSFINMASGVSTEFSNVFIKGDFKYASSKSVLINRNSDTNITIPDLLVSESLTLSDDITLPSNLVVQTNGSLTADTKTFTKESYASGNITINTGSTSLQNIIFDSCGLLKLVSLDNNATMSSLTLNTCTGMEINGGSIDVSTLTIKDASDQFLVTNSAHSGTISNFTIHTTVDHDLSFINMASGVSTAFNNVFIKGDFKYASSKPVLINRNSDTNITIPDLLISESLTISDDITLPSNLVVQASGSIIADSKTFTKESYASGNITINTGSSSLQTITFNSCGLLKLVGLDSNATMSSLTLNNCTGMQVEGGSVDVSTVTINSATSDYLVSDDHTGTISGMTFNLDSNFSSNSLIKLGASTSTSTTLSGEITVKSSDTNVQLTKDLVIFDVTAYDSNETFPDVLLDDSTEFVLDSNTIEYKIFSNIKFEGSVNCVGSKFVRDVDANSNCNVTLKDDTKVFSNMSLESCGTLILDNLSTSSTISSFTSVSSPTVGLQISGGSVDVSTITVNSATGKYVVVSSHSGEISNATFILPDSTTDALMDIQSGTTTFTGTTIVKATDTSVEFDKDLNVFDLHGSYTFSDIPDIIFEEPSIFKLVSGESYELFSNTTFKGTVNCDSATISRATGSKSICNITFENNNKVFTSMTLDNCGSLILNSLDNTNSISLTNNNSPSNGLRVEGGSVNISNTIVKDAIDEFLVTNNAHSGTISNFTIHTTIDHDLSFINMASGVSTTFNNVFIKGDFKYASSKQVLINRNNDINITIPDLLISDSLTISDDITLPSNLVVQNGGSLTADTKTFTKESYASGNITINTGSTSLQTITFNSCGLLKLVSLDSNATMSSLTLNNCTGMQVEGGSVDVSTVTINSATSDYLVSDDHTGTISGMTFDLDSNFNSNSLIKLGASTSTSTTLSGEITVKSSDTNVQLTKDLVIFDVTAYDSNETFPDVLLDDSTEFVLDSNTVEYKIFSNIKFEGSVNCVGSKFVRDVDANSNCNVTLKDDTKVFSNMSLESCGTLILDNLSTSSTISSFTNITSPTVGLQISGGSVDVSTLTVNSATGKYVVVSSHSGEISNATFILPDSTTDALMDIQSGTTTFTGTTTVKATDTSVEFDKDLNVFDLHGSYTSSDIPDLVFDEPSIFKLVSGESYELFSNTTFKGTVNCDSATISRAIGAKSICNITFENNNKIFTSMTLDNCGSLILNSLDNTNNISLTNNDSPSNGLYLNGGNVNITSLTVKNAASDNLVSVGNHSGTISSTTFDFESVDSNISLMNLGSSSTNISDTVNVTTPNINSAQLTEIDHSFPDDNHSTYTQYSFTDVRGNYLIINKPINATNNREIIISEDNGTTQEQISIGTGNLGLTTNYCRITNDGNTIYATSFNENDLKKLVKNGSNYDVTNLTPSNFGGRITWLQISDDGKYVLVCVKTRNEVYISDNYGTSFVHTSISVNRADMSSNGQYMALVNKDGTNLIISVSSDYGSNFTTQTLNIGGVSTDDCEVSVSESGQYMLVMASGHNLYVSSDYGSSFSEISDTTKSWNHVEITMKNPRIMYAQVNDSSNTLYESLDYGQTWASIINHGSNVHYNNLCSDTENLFAFNAETKKIDRYTIGSGTTINRNLNVFNLSSRDPALILPDVKFSNTSTFNLSSGHTYELFSNTIFEGAVNFDGATLSRGTGANAICNVTLKDDNKTFTGMTFSNCGALKLENVSSNNTISSFTNNNSPDIGLHIVSGSVDITSIDIKDSINEFVKIESHSGDLKDLKLDTSNTFNKTFVDIASSVTTTFSNTDSNDNGIYIKGSLDHDGSVDMIIDADTNKTIPDLVVDSGDSLVLVNNITLPSNLVVYGDITSSNKTFTTGIRSDGNITINTGSTSLQNTTFNSCGLLKLISLDSNATMSSLTLNTCTGMEINGGSIDVSTLTIKDASAQFLVTNNGHSGTISNFTIDTTVDHDLSFINMASGVSTVFNNVFIKGDFKYASSKPVLINRNSDTNITIPDLLISESLTLSDDITLPSNLVVQASGSLSADGKTFSKESYASGNITINTGSSSLQSTTFNSCGLLKLVSLDSNATMSSLTLNTCTGMEINGGSVDVNTLIIKDASDEFLVTNNAHSGTISNFTIDTTVDHDLSFINMASGVSTTFNNVFIKGDFKYASSKPVLINRNSDTNITIPDLLISESLTVSDDITLPSNLVVQTNGSLIADTKTFTKESYASGNITINTGSTSLQTITFNSCGLLKLVSLDSNATMSSLTLNNCTGMQVEGGSVDVSTVVINSAASDYLVLDDHTGTISGMTFDLDSNFSSNSLIKLGATTSTSTTLSGEITVKTSDTSVELTNDLVIFDVTAYDSNETFPDVLLDNSTEFVLDSNTVEYKIFSNIKFEGSVNCVGSKFVRDVNANSNCNVTLKDDTKVFSNMSLESCGTLILDSLSTSSTISSFTNVSSPTIGLQINGGSVDVSTLTVKDALGEFLVTNSSHSGEISNFTIDTTVDHDLSFINMASGVSTTFNNVFIKGDFKYSSSKSVLINRNNDTNITIPDLLISDSLTLSDDITLPSNLVVQSSGSLISDGKTIDKESYASGNITINTGTSSLQSTTFNSCGLLKLVSLDNNATMSSLTLNTCTGMEINGGSVDVSTLTIKDASDQFLVTNSAHSGTISNLTIHTTVDHDLSFINMASGVSTVFNNVFIKGDFKYASSKPVLINRNSDTNITIPDLLISESLTISDDITLPSNLVVQASGSIIADSKTFTKESYASGNITINTGSSSLQTITFNSCGLLKLVGLDSNATMSSLTLNNCTGMQVEGGSVDVNTVTINSATSDYLVSDDHTGTISGMTFDLDSNFSSNSLIKLGASTSTSTTLSGEITVKSSDTNVQLTKDLVIFDVTAYDSNETFPDVLLDNSTEFVLDSNTVEYKIFSNIKFEGSVNCVGSKFVRDVNANSNCNVTLKDDTKVFSNMSLESCGTLILDSLSTSSTISNFTNVSSPTVGLQISGGSVDVSTLTVNSATGKYVVVSSNSGEISNATFILPDSTTDALMDIQSGTTTFTGTTIVKATDTSVEFDKDLNVFDLHESYTSSDIPDIIFEEPSIFKLVSGESYELFSNTTFKGTVNCDSATISRATGAKSICNITFENNNKVFTGMTLDNCGSLILSSLDNTNSISLTNNDSPSNGLKVDGGSVNISSVTIKNSTNDYLITDNSHTGSISSITFDVNNNDNNLFKLGPNALTNTTLNGPVTVKSSSSATNDANLSIFSLDNYDTNKTIPDVVLDNTTNFVLTSGETYQIFSNIRFDGTVNCASATFSRGTGANAICNITLKDDNKTFTGMTLSACGHLKLDSLSTNNTVTNFTNNSSPSSGLHITSGSVDVTTVTIKDAVGEFVVTDSSHSGTITTLTLDINNSHDESFINLGSGVETSFVNVFVKGTFEHSGTKAKLINRNGDSNIVRPELRVSDSLTISSNMTLSSLLIVLPGGTISAENKTFTQDADAEGGILILAGDGSTDTYGFDQYSSLGTINYGSGGSNTIKSCTLNSLGTLDKYSALTLVGCSKTNNSFENIIVNDAKDSGISIYDGDVELCTTTIRDPVYNYIKTNWGHDGLVHGLTLTATASHTYSLIDCGNGISKQDSGITATAFTNVTYTNTEADTNKNVSLQNTGTVNHGDTNTVVFKVNSGAIVYINGIKHSSSTNAFRASYDNLVSILQRGTFTITFKQNC